MLLHMHHFFKSIYVTCFLDYHFYQNPKFMKEDFQLVIESMHHDGGPDVDNVCKAEALFCLHELISLDLLYRF